MIKDFDGLNQFKNLGIIAKQLVEGFITGLHKSPYHGFSVEFAEHKLYNIGESIRHIDWKIYARTEKLYTKQYEEETNLRCRILLDHSPSMHYPLPSKDKLKFSIFAASALAYLLVSQRDAVGLTVFTNKIQKETELKSTQLHLNRILKELANLQQGHPPQSSTNVAEVLHKIAKKTHKRSLIILFSDMFQNNKEDDLMTALQHLKYSKHEVIIFHVTDHSSELDFSFNNQPHKFVDMETNTSISVNPADIQHMYQQTAKEFYQKLKIKCGLMKIDFFDVNTSDSFNKVLEAFLIKRKKMN